MEVTDLCVPNLCVNDLRPWGQDVRGTEWTQERRRENGFTDGPGVFCDRFIPT